MTLDLNQFCRFYSTKRQFPQCKGCTEETMYDCPHRHSVYPQPQQHGLLEHIKEALHDQAMDLSLRPEDVNALVTKPEDYEPEEKEI